MGKAACILGAVVFLSLGEVLPNSQKDDSYMIRRAYLDVLGVVPTIEETEWYCVYNTNGYFLAVDWLSNHPDYLAKNYSNPKDLSELLLSSAYKNAVKIALSDKKRKEIVFYISGHKYSVDDNKYREAKLAMIAAAKMCASGDLDVLDYMASQLMSRTTNVAEANDLLKKLKHNLSMYSEEDAWLATVDYLLEFEDVRSK